MTCVLAQMRPSTCEHLLQNVINFLTLFLHAHALQALKLALAPSDMHFCSDCVLSLEILSFAKIIFLWHDGVTQTVKSKRRGLSMFSTSHIS